MIGIYRFVNKNNNKSYIGQSINIEERRKKHIAASYYPPSNTYNTVFHKAIRKYGVDSFEFEILTLCKIEELDSLEKYYISKYNSMVPNGYNMTAGGENARSINCKFSQEDIKNIITDLRTTYDTSEEIGKKWGCSASLIKKISSGEEYYIDGETYPIRTKEHILEVQKRKNCFCLGINPAAKLNVDIVQDIVYDLLNTDIKIKDLALKYNISSDQISRINNGKIWLQVERPIPCRDIKKENERKALLVADLLLKTNLTQKEILKETGYKDRHTISRINKHEIYQDLLSEYPIPIRK